MRWLARRKGVILLVGLFLAGFPLALKAQQPTVTQLVPNNLYPGSAPDVILFGTNFKAGAQCDFGAGIAVNFCKLASSTQLTANLTITAAAPSGSHDVTVTNPDGTSATLTSGVDVAAPRDPIQHATFSVQSDTSGTATVMLPHNVGQLGVTLLIGLNFWPADGSSVTDVTSVTVSGPRPGSSLATRGLTNSILHDVPGSPLYTNYYYVNMTDSESVQTITINFNGGSTHALVAVAEVRGAFSAGDRLAFQFAYNESKTPTSTWSDPMTPAAFNEYLFAWGATRNSTTCASPASAWTIEDQSNDPAGATICLLDKTAEAAGQVYQASVNSSSPQDYAMGMIAFDYFQTDFGGPSPLPVVSSAHPNSGSPGQNLANVTIAGSDFNENSHVNFVCSFGADITVNSCVENSSTQLTANITIDAKAAPGPRNVTVTNWDVSFVVMTFGGTVANAFTVVPPPPQSDFTISLAAPAQSVLPGGTAAFKLNLTAGTGFDQPVSLGCSSVPAGVSCLAPPPVTPTASGASAAMTIEVGDTAAPSTTPNSFTITGTSAGLSHSVAAQISVAELSASIAPPAATINVGSSSDFDVSLTATDAFTGPVMLNCAALAPGLRCVVPAPAAVPGSATLAVFVDSKPGTSLFPPSAPGNAPWPSSRSLPLMLAALVLLALVLQRGVILSGVAARLFSSGQLFGPRSLAAKNLSSRAISAGIASWHGPSVAALATFAFALVLAVSLISCGGATTTSNSTGGSATTPSATGAGGSGSGGSGSGTGGSGGSGGSGSGGSGGTGGGGSTSVTTQFTVQAQSGGATVNLGTILITVP